MKVLFLDVDGVLNKASDYRVVQDGEGNYLRLNYDLLRNLCKIIEDTECKIVLSSSWRNVEGGRIFLDRFIPIHDETITLGGYRGREIEEWLKRHSDVTNYAIVDDDGDMLPEQLVNFFQTEFESGLSETIAYRVTYHLIHGPRKEIRLV